MPLRAVISRKESRNGRWFAVFVGIVMLASVAAYVFSINPSSQAGNFRYAGLTFRQDAQGFYASEFKGQPLNFNYKPESVSDITLPEGTVQKLTGTTSLQMTYYWNSSLAQRMALSSLTRQISLMQSTEFSSSPASPRPIPSNNL